MNFFTSCNLARRFHAASLKDVGTEAFLAHTNDLPNQHTAFLDLSAMIYTNDLPVNCSFGQLLADSEGRILGDTNDKREGAIS